MAFNNAKKRKFDYFEAMSSQAALASESARLLIEVMENYPGPDSLDEIIVRAHEVEHKGDFICHDIYNNLAVDFITPIEREDIIAVASALDDILDYCEGTVQRFYMYDVEKIDPAAIEFARLILKCCEKLEIVVKEFKNFKSSKILTAQIIEVGDAEEEADKLFVKVIRELFHNAKKGEVDSDHAYIWNSLYKRLEDTADTCEKVADAIGMVVLKNS